MKKTLLLFLTIVFAASITVVYGQQLKTFHHLEGYEDSEGLTYTGYEDELGHITPHGRFTWTAGKFTFKLNYKNGKLDGDISLENSYMTCKIKYKEGKWLEINYRQEKYRYYKYNDYMYGKLAKGPIILKCSRTEQDLPIGDFELTFIAPNYDSVSIKGKFDNSGKAIGCWEQIGIEGCLGHFEQGYCLGNSEYSKNWGRKFYIEKSISEQQLNNQGFYAEDIIKIKCRVINSHEAHRTISNMLYENFTDIINHINDQITSLCKIEDLNINFDDAFLGNICGNPISYMSSELYQKLKTDPSQFKYDNNLQKYYVVKTDGKSRLYIPLELEEEYDQYLIQKEELERQKKEEKRQKEEEKRRNEEEVKRWADSLLKEGMAKEAITEIQKRLDIMMKDRSGYNQYPNSKQFYPIVKYSIGNAQVHCRYDLSDCEITVSVILNVGDNNKSGYFESYKTNVIVNEERTGNYRIDQDRSFVKKERVNNIWDSIASLKNDSKSLEKQLLSNTKYSSIVASYKKEDVSYNIKETDPQKQYDYYTKIINVQKAYLKFIDLVNQIDNVSNEIIVAAKDESDIAKSYQNTYKSWNLSVNKNIYEEVKRLEESDYRNIQDSCLTFIELRKTITQNNAKIAGYAKAAPTIVKAYNTYMKGVNLTWTPEPSRNQAIREIINTQNALINELSKPNISEVDKTVKKSKAKTWEDVKKIVFQ